MIALDQLPPQEVLDDELAYRYLSHFIRELWSTVETEPYQHSWHIDAIAQHLQAVLEGKITRLIINIPPRCMKSLAVSVFFPAWVWLHRPELRFLFSSYAHTLSKRDSVKCRRVLESPRFRRLVERYRPGFALAPDQNEKIKYDNSAGGYRLSTSVDGALTGEGGDIIVVDDPHNVVEGESEAIRNSTLRWWDEAMSTRLNNPSTGAYIIIMQRVHEEDLTGHILSKDTEGLWDHLCLPAEYEGDRVVSSLDFCDPRTEMGESLWPMRLTETVLEGYRSTMTSYAYAGQFQQRPAPREGGLFKVGKLLEVETINANDIITSVRYWDKAGTQGGGCQTAGVLMHRLRSGMFAVGDVVTGHWSAGERERKIKETAKRDGNRVTIYVEQEPGSGGLESAESTIRGLAGYRVKKDRPTGSKEVRAEPFACQVEIGNVIVARRGWTRKYKEELAAFPNGKYRDQVDASSGAFNKVAKAGAGFVPMA